MSPLNQLDKLEPGGIPLAEVAALRETAEYLTRESNRLRRRALVNGILIGIIVGVVACALIVASAP